MALAFDATSNSGNQTSVSTYSWSHTCTGSNLILVVGVSAEANATPSNMPVTGITYNGVALTKADEQNTTVTPGGSADITSLWYLINPATGTHTIQVTHTGVIEGAVGGSVSYTGADQSSNPNKMGGNKGNSGTASVALTSTVNGCVYVDVVNGSGSANAITPDATQTQRWNVTSTGHIVAGGSTFAQTSAGAKTMQWTFTSEIWAISALVIEPVQAAITNHFLAMMGVGS